MAARRAVLGRNWLYVNMRGSGEPAQSWKHVAGFHGSGALHSRPRSDHDIAGVCSPALPAVIPRQGAGVSPDKPAASFLAEQ